MGPGLMIYSQKWLLQVVVLCLLHLITQCPKYVIFILRQPTLCRKLTFKRLGYYNTWNTF